MPRRIETHLLDGPAGRLESLLEEPADRQPLFAALVCHPHPLFGGSMHNKVVHRVARGLRRAGAVVLRFNFRGVGSSQGEYAHGSGELDDAGAALAWLRARYPALPFAVAGFSFGARIALGLGCRIEPRPLEVLAVGFPTSRGGYEYLYSCDVPKAFIQSTRDEHGPKPDLEAVFTRIAEPKQIQWVEAADHFFSDTLDELETKVYRLGCRVAELALHSARRP